eukprot:COSAG02_NODE_64880_length_259_cov_0.812500_1_plen_47_part_10
MAEHRRATASTSLSISSDGSLSSSLTRLIAEHVGPHLPIDDTLDDVF